MKDYDQGYVDGYHDALAKVSGIIDDMKKNNSVVNNYKAILIDANKLYRRIFEYDENIDRD